MEEIRSATTAGDAFAFIDKTKRDFAPCEVQKGRKPLQEMLLDGVFDKVNLVYIPLKRLRPGHVLKIQTHGLTLAQATHDLKVRVRLGRWHGIDVSD